MYDIDTDKINMALQPILEKFFAAFPATNASPLTVLTYAEDLSDYPLDIVAEATTILRRTHRLATIPTIAEILAEVQRIASDRQQAIRKAQATAELSAKEKDLAYEEEKARGEAIPCPWGADFLREMKKVFNSKSMPGCFSNASLDAVVPSKGAPLPPEILAKYAPRKEQETTEAEREADWLQ